MKKLIVFRKRNFILADSKIEARRKFLKDKPRARIINIDESKNGKYLIRTWNKKRKY